MIMTRSSAITAAVAAAAALTATGVTYAVAAPASAPQAAPAVVQQAPVPAQAPMGDEGGKGNERGGERGERGHGENEHHRRVGRIFVNERSFSAHPDGCITVISGLGSKSFNIRNDVESVHVEDGVVGSFRVIHRHHDKEDFDFDY
ncbi:hypothetical protein [Streptomyces triticisoli]|uniref:hypothetical protein n=1 Tax=Streptomyces triticisoli TaxID=2182797 RepID=UPI001E5A90C2|nr:hypothetical protein [Streptomyces triticisoli]